MKKIACFLLSFVILGVGSTHAKIVTYQFDIDQKIVNFTGKDVVALAINNQIPGPTIEATVDDILEVTFNNKLNTETSIHWHGILLPNDQDGVPYLTTPPIAAKSSFTYRYKVTHHGTYWYHSHTGLQEQKGMYGSIIFHPKEGEKLKSSKDYVVVLSDWTNENPHKVLANLKRDGDYYALKKGSVQSWDKVIKHGSRAIKNRLYGSFTRMGPMDISDVGYDLFLVNGAKSSNLKAQKGDDVRVRVINAGASSYFNLEFSGSPMKIVAADGVDINPILVKKLRIAIAETYDLIIPIKNNKSYELRATSEDGTGYSSVFIGNGEKIYAPDLPRPNLFFVDHSAHGGHGDSNNNHESHQHHKGHNNQNKIIPYMTDYNEIKAINRTEFSKEKPIREITFKLTGTMEGYVWSLNNKTLLESEAVMIKKGETVRFILDNTTMMHHPIHLHGHFFRVLNKQKEYSPLKHTVNVSPMDKVIIEFDADQEKDWFFHCHNLYHMKTGMTRVISYEDTTTITKEKIKKLGHDKWYFMSDLYFLSNMSMGSIRTSNTKNKVDIEYDCNYKKEYDIEAIYERRLTKFFGIYAGLNLERDDKEEKPENTGILGIKYILPMLIESNLRINSKGKLKLFIGSDLQITERNKVMWSYNTEKDYRIGLSYEINKNFLLSAVYDSDFKFGLGVKFNL